MRAKILISTFVFFLAIELSCGSDEECKRDCSKAVRNNNVKIDTIIPGDTSDASTVTCWQNTQPISSHRRTRFVTYTEDEAGNKIPRANVLITPLLDDGVGGGWISTEYDQEEHTEIGLRGIITKASEFCSDSCGIVDIEYGVRCPGTTDTEDHESSVKLEINAGASATRFVTKIIQKGIKKE